MTHPLTDYRQLCTELIDKIEGWVVYGDEYGDRIDIANTHVLLDRARAALAEPERQPTFAELLMPAPALAEPEPEVPTDEEIMELMPQQMRDDLAAAARAMAGFDPDNIQARSIFRIILNRHAVDHCRAVLARWGK